MTVRAVSYGGGVQSTALLVLAAQGYIDFPLFLFANVGDDSEDPETLRYLREVAFDYAAAHGIELHELHRRTRDGNVETLYGRLIKEGTRSLPIPVRMPDTGAPGTRNCTMDFKIRVVGRWLQTERGASAESPAVVGVGISTDEHMRANNRRARPYELLEYPLLNLEWQGSIGLNRNQCEAVIRSAGLPVPPKSSCYFCPFHRPSHWADMARDRPELFEKSAALEDLLNDRRDQLRCPGSARRPLEARTRVVLRGDSAPLEVSDRDAAEFDPEDPDVVAVLPLPYAQPSGACPTCHRRFDVDTAGALPVPGEREDSRGGIQVGWGDADDGEPPPVGVAGGADVVGGVDGVPRAGFADEVVEQGGRAGRVVDVDGEPADGAVGPGRHRSLRCRRRRRSGSRRRRRRRDPTGGRVGRSHRAFSGQTILSVLVSMDRARELHRWRPDPDAVWRWRLGPNAPAPVDVTDLEALLKGRT